MKTCPICGAAPREIWREGALAAFRCDACGYVGSRGGEPARYEDDYFERWYLARRDERLAFFEALLDDLAEAPGFALEAPLLDLGAGVGHWLEVCRGRGVAEGVAVEPSAFGRRQIETALPGLEIHAGLDALAAQPGRFATLTILDVLSHVEDLPGTLAAALRLLRPGGRLVVKAPNHPPRLFAAARVLAPLGRGRALLAARSQLHHFSAESLAGLLEGAGLVTTQLQRRPELPVPRSLDLRAWALQRLTRALVGPDSLLWTGTAPEGG